MTASTLRRMTPRRRDEPHRAATPLELLFDLCFVVAVAQAGSRLVHALAEDHAGHGAAGYVFTFFGIWWAWMNFSWFASAYDTDDVPYRVATLVQIAGVLVFAAGVPSAFDRSDWLISVIGYVIMRLALTFQWLRAARAANGPARRTALVYAAGVVACQLGWVGLLWVPAGRWQPVCFVVLIVAELSVPLLAERGHTTPWHPEHIAERYGLFTLIVLGETVSAATLAVQSALDEHDALDRLLPIAAGGLLIVFAAWWIYFAVPIHGHLRSNRQAIPWGYGHYAVFASAAAIGAGIEVSVEQAVGATRLDVTAASAAVTVPTAVYLLTLWLLHARHYKRGPLQQAVLPVTSVAVLAVTFTGRAAVPCAGVICALAVAVGVTLAARTGEGPSDEAEAGAEE
ncbi:low temperature requirement protein A [Streptomyces sp. SL13]|uniref:Low temperature requirement protein A n=1 Tax=Streptantibioticus silvisoli TaxID=2705255 RepID=A0AA90JZX3_9ACTN|nr:low temperature requirement protein A [Streptantibioticus silvisoli]MDI5972491.1 low temperature requirement protein A [Streptantibioticus silvisoli]